MIVRVEKCVPLHIALFNLRAFIFDHIINRINLVFLFKLSLSTKKL